MATLITLISDASLKDGKGGWACYLKREHQTHRAHGQLKGHISTSSEAETMAIANAIALLSKVNALKGDRLLIQADSTQALGTILTFIPHATVKHYSSDPCAILPARVMTARQRAAAEYIRDHTTNASRIFLRHLRGHQSDKSSRTWAHNWCDEMAKQARMSK